MSIIEDIEEKTGVKIETLNDEERSTFYSMLNEVHKAQLTPEKLREYIIQMRSAVELDLIKEPEFKWLFIFRVANRKQILLKARLQNYMLLESFLMSPERAKQMLEEAVTNVTKSIS